jgi:hypothetical protein
MAIASEIREDKYCDKEVVDERTHYLLNLSDVDSADVVLCGLIKRGLKVGVPIEDFHEFKKSENYFLSKIIGGSYLQALINEQVGNTYLHRSYTQLREMREFADGKHKRFKSIEDLTSDWISSKEASKFAENYPKDFSGYLKVA